jgi:predicted esterase
MRGGFALALVLAIAAGSGSAHAEVALVPAADGHLGAVLAAGPLPTAPDLSSLRPSKGGKAAGAAFRLLAVADGGFNLGRALGTGEKAGAHAALGGELELSEDLDGFLLVSADGPASAWLDGKRIWSRDSGRLRGLAWDVAPLSATQGRHTLVLGVRHPGSWWAVELRVLDAKTLSAPRGLTWHLPGTTDADQRALARDLATTSLDTGLAADGYHPRLRVEYRRGAPAGGDGRVTLAVTAGKLRSSRSAGTLLRESRGALPLEIALPLILPGDLSNRDTLGVEAHIGEVSFRLEAPLDASAPELFARAEQQARAVREGKPKLLDPETVATTLTELAHGLGGRNASTRASLEHWLGELDAGRDPMKKPGLVRVWRRSRVDDRPDETLVHVPAELESKPGARLPLVVALHGLNGTPSRIMEAFLDSKSTAPSVDGFVLAPYAHGNAFYRGPGELEVMQALDWMLATYPIDPDRVAITGVSMGGTGTGHLALRYAERFSRAAPLCGYHSFFVRRDTHHRPLRAWERERMHHWSPASWAENGNNLPMWVAHGTKDFPLENSKVLVTRYKELGYSMTDEWPETGHDVWTKAYAGARLWPWLSRGKRDPAAAHVVVKTDVLRFGKDRWARITALEKPGHMGVLDAEVKGPSEIVVKTDAISAFELERAAGRVSADGPVTVLVDGESVSFAAGEKLALRRASDGWEKGAAPAGKRAGVEGPIRDAYLEPLLFVYGALDPRTTRANREVAEAFAHARPGPEVAYRVIPDSALDDALEASHSLFLVGTPQDHRLLAAIGAQLPIRVADGALWVGADARRAPGTGAIFIHPNPRHPERYVVVVTGLDPAGIWRALSLPQLLPDFLVYDATLAPAAAEVVLGEARVLDGGFFDQSWRLPADHGDR